MCHSTMWLVERSSISDHDQLRRSLYNGGWDYDTLDDDIVNNFSIWYGGTSDDVRIAENVLETRVYDDIINKVG